MDMTLVDLTDAPSAQPGDEVVLFGPAAGRIAGDTRDSRFASTLEATIAALDADPREAVPGGAYAHLPVAVEDVAAWAEAIPHEILSGVGSRVPRVYRTSSPDDDPEGGR
jgi:alanine racemase